MRALSLHLVLALLVGLHGPSLELLLAPEATPVTKPRLMELRGGLDPNPVHYVKQGWGLVTGGAKRVWSNPVFRTIATLTETGLSLALFAGLFVAVPALPLIFAGVAGFSVARFLAKDERTVMDWVMTPTMVALAGFGAFRAIKAAGGAHGLLAKQGGGLTRLFQRLKGRLWGGPKAMKIPLVERHPWFRQPTSVPTAPQGVSRPD